MGVIRDCGGLSVHVPNKELGLDALEAGESNFRIVKPLIYEYLNNGGHIRAMSS